MIYINDTLASIQIFCIGKPTHYRVSELETIEGSEWVTFPDSFIITYPTVTSKIYTLFIQVKSAVMESNIKIITFEKRDPYIQILLKTIILNNGDTSITTNVIPIVLQYDGIPTNYKLAVNPVEENGVINWDLYSSLPYNEFPNSVVVPETPGGTQKIWVKLIDDRSAETSLSSSIIYIPQILPSITSVIYPETTVQEQVLVSVIFTGGPTEYSCELSVNPPVWKSFSSDTFVLPIINIGSNTYTLILKNSIGISNTYQFTITYTPPVFGINSFTLNNGAASTQNTLLNLTLSFIGTEVPSELQIATSLSELDTALWVPYVLNPTYEVPNPGMSGPISVYLKAKSTEGTITDVVYDSIDYVFVTPPEVKMLGVNNDGTNLYRLLDGKYYSFARAQFATIFDMYDFNSGQKLDGWRVMNDTETVTEFGAAGENLGNNTTNLLPDPWKTRVNFYNNGTKFFYLGWYVPNGTYIVSFLFSLDTVSADTFANVGWIFRVNGNNQTVPNTNLYNNQNWIHSANIVVTDGKLKLAMSSSVINKNVGFNGIQIRKIS